MRDNCWLEYNQIFALFSTASPNLAKCVSGLQATREATTSGREGEEVTLMEAPSFQAFMSASKAFSTSLADGVGRTSTGGSSSAAGASVGFSMDKLSCLASTGFLLVSAGSKTRAILRASTTHRFDRVRNEHCPEKQVTLRLQMATTSVKCPWQEPHQILQFQT